MNETDIDLLAAYRIVKKIRSLADKQALLATKSRKDGRWYFADECNYLPSWEGGLTYEEALEFLKS